MDKKEFRLAIKRCGLTCDEFALLTGRNLNTIYGFGERSPVPYYACVILKLLKERGRADDLLPPMEKRW